MVRVSGHPSTARWFLRAHDAFSSRRGHGQTSRRFSVLVRPPPPVSRDCLPSQTTASTRHTRANERGLLKLAAPTSLCGQNGESPRCKGPALTLLVRHTVCSRGSALSSCRSPPPSAARRGGPSDGDKRGALPLLSSRWLAVAPRLSLTSTDTETGSDPSFFATFRTRT